MFSLESISTFVVDWPLRLSQAIGNAANERFLDVTAPIYIGAVVFILVLERVIPARPEQPLLSAGRLQDVTWVFLEAIGGATVTIAWVMLLRSLYERHLDFLTLELELDLPAWLTVIAVLIMMDFLRWLQHVIQHKVP